MSERKITTVVFDIGSVLAIFPWREYLKSFRFPAETEERIAQALFLSENWQEADRGAKSDEEIYQNCLNEIPDLEQELSMVWKDRITIVREYDYSTDWICSLKKAGYKVYLLSNYGKTTFLEAMRCFEFLKHVDGKVISYEIKYIKPEPQIYEELIRRFDLIPEECVFLDDLPQNVKAAEEFGFHTILFTEREKALLELEALGVKCEP